MSGASRFTVWLAADRGESAESLGKCSSRRPSRVILKTCHVGREREPIAALVSELEGVVRLRHRNLAAIYEVGLLGDYFFAAMEHVRGRDLSQILGGRCLLCPSVREDAASGASAPRDLWPWRVVPEDVALWIALEVCKGLEHLHEQTGRLHGEITPWRVMVGFDGGVKLLNVGLTPIAARLKADSIAESWAIFRYKSPEQVVGRPIDERTDLYSLGLVLHELLLGRPWIGGDADSGLLAEVMAAPRPSRALLGALGVPSSASEVLLCALHPEPARRFQSAREMAEGLRFALDRAGRSPTRETVARTMWRLFQRPNVRPVKQPVTARSLT